MPQQVSRLQMTSGFPGKLESFHGGHYSCVSFGEQEHATARDLLESKVDQMQWMESGFRVIKLFLKYSDGAKVLQIDANDAAKSLYRAKEMQMGFIVTEV